MDGDCGDEASQTACANSKAVAETYGDDAEEYGRSHLLLLAHDDSRRTRTPSLIAIDSIDLGIRCEADTDGRKKELRLGWWACLRPHQHQKRLGPTTAFRLMRQGFVFHDHELRISPNEGVGGGTSLVRNQGNVGEYDKRRG